MGRTISCVSLPDHSACCRSINFCYFSRLDCWRAIFGWFFERIGRRRYVITIGAVGLLISSILIIYLPIWPRAILVFLLFMFGFSLRQKWFRLFIFVPTMLFAT